MSDELLVQNRQLLSRIPLIDSSHIGDEINKWINSSRDWDTIKTLLISLQNLLRSAIQDDCKFDEDKLIEVLFSRADTEFEEQAHPETFSLANGKSCKTRTTEVVNNYSGQEQEVPDFAPSTQRNPYLDDADFAKATLCCCDEFLTWLLKRIDNPQMYGFSRVSLPIETIAAFVQDFSSTGLITNFCKTSNPREKQTFTLPMFLGIETFALFGCLPDNPGREIMAIFSIRQMLESWFMRIVGFRGVVPIDDFDLRSGRFQRIIQQGFETAFHFPSKSANVSFKSIRLIYLWTQASIHWAYSTNIWLLWKAMTYCERLFGATIELQALEKYRKEVITLCLEAAKFVKETKNQNQKKDRPSQRTIVFRDPDIKVSNNGKLVDRFDTDENGFSLLERNVIITKKDSKGELVDDNLRRSPSAVPRQI